MKKNTKTAPRQVRIIGGNWKRTPLPVLEAEGLRPTPDRVRETLFNWLGFLQSGGWHQIDCLDLFAGTGALGFEAASRGARKVVLVESHPAALQQLSATRDKLAAAQVSVQRGDALMLAARMADKFNLIFLDPPYQLQLLPRLMPLCRSLLAPGGLVYAEDEQSFETEPRPDWLAGWEVVRADKAGMVHYALLSPNLQSPDSAKN
jgi:16S rRNA (guanine(966)-N(2))-methyltransferase RsmD